MTAAATASRRLLGLVRRRCRGGRQMRVDVAELTAVLGCGERTLWAAVAAVARTVSRCRVWSHRCRRWETLLGLRAPLPRDAAGRCRHPHASGADPAAECAVAAARRLRAEIGAGECSAHLKGGPKVSMAPVPGGLAAPVRMAWAAARKLLTEFPALSGSAALLAHWLRRHGATDKAAAAARRGAVVALGNAADAARWRGGKLVRPVSPPTWLRALAQAERRLGERPPVAARTGPPPPAKPAPDAAWRRAKTLVESWRPASGSLRASLAALLA